LNARGGSSYGRGLEDFMTSVVFLLYLLSGEGDFTNLGQFPNRDDCAAKATELEAALPQSGDEKRLSCLSTDSMEIMVKSNGYSFG